MCTEKNSFQNFLQWQICHLYVQGSILLYNFQETLIYVCRNSMCICLVLIKGPWKIPKRLNNLVAVRFSSSYVIILLCSSLQKQETEVDMFTLQFCNSAPWKTSNAFLHSTVQICSYILGDDLARYACLPNPNVFSPLSRSLRQSCSVA